MMPHPLHHPECPRCKGEGFYLAHHGRGYYRDGSFGHNQWRDCDCDASDDLEDLPAAVVPSGDPF
jgi:ribosomal protein S27AE